ncbi:MerR family transcriptional regulator [Arsenicicoccus piscis]|nr:MerR family transcriptional regulator [Arsenicicoccus piscis]MCH8626289.1 MerR family transcriptional regulator [Arsenicicoccus piscis]
MRGHEAGLAELVEAAIARLVEDPTDLPTREEIAAAAVPPVPAQGLSMGQMVAFSGLGEHALRYYEREGLVRVARTARGQRRYDADAEQRILPVSRLRISGMSMRTLAELCRLLDEHGQHDPRVRTLVLTHRDRLRRTIAELQLALAITDYKLETGHLQPDPGAASDRP